MSIFDPVSIGWKGYEYRVASDEVMGLVEVIEEHITLDELAEDNVKRSRLANAYASVLRYAGCKEANLEEQVYLTFFDDTRGLSTVQKVDDLLRMMVPKKNYVNVDQNSKEEKKPEDSDLLELPINSLSAHGG